MSMDEIIVHFWVEWFSVPLSVATEEKDVALSISFCLVGVFMLLCWGVIENIFCDTLTKEKKKIYFWLCFFGILVSILLFVLVGVVKS